MECGKLIDDINYTQLEPVLLRINQNNVNPSENITRSHKLAYQDFIVNLNKALVQNDAVLTKYKKIDTEDIKLKTLRSRIGKCYNAYEYEIKVPLPSTLYRANISKPGYITLLLLSNNQQQEDDVTTVLKSWVNQENFMLPEKFILWGEKLIEKCIGINSKKFKKFSVILEKLECGGFNIHVKKLEPLVEFDVKITFTLNFNTTPSTFVLKHNDMLREKWIAVPIVPRNKPGFKNWRYSFPPAEKIELTDLNYLKCVLRLIKILREAVDLTYLSNYHIKTVFMLEVESQNDKFWMKGLSYLFIMMICKLQLALEKNEIPFYWDRTANLLDDLSDTELDDCRLKLSSFITKIRQSFTVKPPVTLDDFLVNKDDDDILSQSMLNFK